jgi:pimeloyl-ACP methyl ester carboxylesterase
MSCAVRTLQVVSLVFVGATAWAGGAGLQAPLETAVDLTTATGTISGTLLLPSTAARMPVALLIAGSGPTDRDGNSPMLPGKNDSYKLLAAALAADGIASLRFDKRGIARSASAGPKEADLRFETYVDDAAAWIAKLRTDARFSTVTVIGHSEGSLIGMIAARTANADAFVSMSGIARGAADVLRDQLRPRLPPDLWQTSESILASLESGKSPDIAVPALLAALYRPSVQPYLISWFKYIPAVEIAKLSVPVLIIQGTTDMQVAADEARALKAAKPNAQLDLVDGMNHVLKAVPADQAAQVASYSDPSLAIVPEVPKTIVTFIRGLRRP